MTNRPGSPLSVGIDVGGTNVHGVVLDGADVVIAEALVATSPGPEGIHNTIAEVAAALATQAGTSLEQFTSVGIGIPGIVVTGNGYVRRAVNVGLAEIDLAGALSDIFAADIRLENDVKATALGAQTALGSDVRDLCYVNVGTGLATAAICAGSIVRGTGNGAGELGHFIFEPGGELCGCGQRGCFETVLGGSYMNPRLNGLGLQLISLPFQGSEVAHAELQRIVSGMASFVTLAVLAYDSEVVVLGGGVIRAVGWITGAVAAELRERAEHSPLLAGMELADRLTEVGADVPVAAIGAAVVGRG